MSSSREITQLLIQLRDGKEGACDELYPLIYDRLQKIANRQLSKCSNNHTYSSTELVHEAYLKMIDQTKIEVNDRNHFMAIASRCMRQILIDYARKKGAKKRGDNKIDLTFIDEFYARKNKKARELIDIDDALNRLEKLNERLSKVVEMRFFGNMTIPQTADALGISESTVKRDWCKARGWLYKELKGRFEVGENH